MRTLLRTSLITAALMAAFPAIASENPLVITSNSDSLNIADLSMDGNANSLTLLQETPLGATAQNLIRVSLEGERNGGPAGAAFTGAALTSGLMPGHLTQQGEGNSIDIGVLGSSNLFAVAQIGDANVVSATITGSGNQAAVQQFGSNNFAVFSQTGYGNIVSITQRSR